MQKIDSRLALLSHKNLLNKISPLLLTALLLSPSPTRAFLVEVHKDVTFDALTSISRPVRDQAIGFTEAAILSIQAENARTDFIFGGFLTPTNHFDDELFAAASQRLMALKNEIIGILFLYLVYLRMERGPAYS